MAYPVYAPPGAATPSQPLQMDDFEPKWFRHLPDPVYQLMHPAKCCWCCCAIPTGAMVISVLVLLGALSDLSTGAGLVAGSGFIPQGMQILIAQQRAAEDAQEAQQAPSMRLLSAGLALLPPLPLTADVTVPEGDDLPFNPPAPPSQPWEGQGGPGMGPAPLNFSDPEVARLADELATYMEVSGVLAIITGCAGLAVCLAAFSTLCCDSRPKILRHAGEGKFGTAFLHVAVTVIMALVAPAWVSSNIVFTGIVLLITVVINIHFAGVLYQAARMRHFGQGGQGALQGATATAAPPLTGVPNLGATLPPGVAVHTSGVPGGNAGL